MGRKVKGGLPISVEIKDNTGKALHRIEADTLVGADLQGADLRHANLRDANLEGANLTDAFLFSTRLDSVRYDDKTRWPDGFDPHKLAVPAGISRYAEIIVAAYSQ